MVKATLSLNARIYKNFQNFCKERAIMLSKRVEIELKKLLENKGYNEHDEQYKTPSSTKKTKTTSKNQKITLSLNDKIYSDFKKFCNENAFLLSKKIELIMNDIMQNEFEKEEKK